MSDWLDTDQRVPALPIPVELPADPSARVALAEQCWAALSDKQHVALTAFRNNRLSARKMEKETGIGRRTHRGWVQGDLNYATIVRLWLGVAGSEALDKDRLLARQDDIVETLLTPKPILHQGCPTGYEEVEAGAAARANETLMKAAGLLKDKELEINVGIQIGPPTLNIQVMPAPPSQIAKREGITIDAKFTEVPSEDAWLTE